MDMCLPKFDIYQGVVASNCFKCYKNSWCPDFFQKKFYLMPGLKFTFSNKTPFLPDNLSELKQKLYLGLNEMIAIYFSKFLDNLYAASILRAH